MDSRTVAHRRNGRKAPTPEQQAKAEARRQQFRQLAADLAALTPEQRQAIADHAGAVVTIEGRALSIHNTCLVAVQCPSATVVGGFRQWLSAGRCVRKGEHGLMIWAPTTKRTDGDAPSEPEPSPDGMVALEGTSASPAFIMVTVFDVAQTEVAS